MLVHLPSLPQGAALVPWNDPLVPPLMPELHRGPEVMPLAKRKFVTNEPPRLRFVRERLTNGAPAPCFRGGVCTAAARVCGASAPPVDPQGRKTPCGDRREGLRSFENFFREAVAVGVGGGCQTACWLGAVLAAPGALRLISESSIRVVSVSPGRVSSRWPDSPLQPPTPASAGAAGPGGGGRAGPRGVPGGPGRRPGASGALAPASKGGGGGGPGGSRGARSNPERSSPHTPRMAKFAARAPVLQRLRSQRHGRLLRGPGGRPGGRAVSHLHRTRDRRPMAARDGRIGSRLFILMKRGTRSND